MMNEQSFRREENTSALLNIDHDGLQAYKARDFSNHESLVAG